MDWLQISATVVPIITFIGWFWNRIDKKFHKIDEKFDKIDEKFEKLDEKFKDLRSEIKEVREELKELRTGLNRMEGAFYSKECCMIKDTSQIKKAE